MTNTTPDTDPDHPVEEAPQEAATAEVAENQAEPVGEAKASGSRITPIRVAIAVAAVAAAWQSYGLARDLLTEPRIAFEAHESIVSLDEAVAEAGIEEMIVPLTKGDGKIDIIYAGAPGCPHCQDFVSGEFKHYPEGAHPAPTSFGDMIALAREKGLDVAYMPLAMSSIDAVIASGEACAPANDAITPAQRVEISYGLLTPLSGEADKARKMIEDMDDPEKIRGVLTGALEMMNEKFAPGSEFDAECYEARVKDYGEAIRGFYDVFGQHGTPSFYFHEDTGTVSRFSGSGGVAPMMRQVAQ